MRPRPQKDAKGHTSGYAALLRPARPGAHVELHPPPQVVHAVLLCPGLCPAASAASGSTVYFGGRRRLPIQDLVDSSLARKGVPRRTRAYCHQRAGSHRFGRCRAARRAQRKADRHTSAQQVRNPTGQVVKKAASQGCPEQDTGAGVARAWRGRSAGLGMGCWGSGWRGHGAGVARACPVPRAAGRVGEGTHNARMYAPPRSTPQRRTHSQAVRTAAEHTAAQHALPSCTPHRCTLAILRAPPPTRTAQAAALHCPAHGARTTGIVCVLGSPR
eukprot:gene23538-biopygen8875